MRRLAWRHTYGKSRFKYCTEALEARVAELLGKEAAVTAIRLLIFLEVNLLKPLWSFTGKEVSLSY